MSASLGVLFGSSTFTTVNGTKTSSGTPSVGDLLLMITAHTGNTSTTAPTDDQTGGTYTLVATAQKVSSADTMKMWVRDALVASAVSHTFTHAPGTTSGGGLIVYTCSGVTRTGASAILQSATQSNQAAATPAPVMASAVLTTNGVLGAVFNGTNPATMTPRSSPAYTEGRDDGYGSPTTGVETMRINSGETATTITWGSASASEFAAIVAEIDISALPAALGAFHYYAGAGSMNV